MGRITDRRNIWSIEETYYFLTILLHKNVFNDAKLKQLRKNEIFKTIVVPAMKKGGYHRDECQMAIKLKNLKGEYKKYKDHNAIEGHEPKHWEFYNAMETLMRICDRPDHCSDSETDVNEGPSTSKSLNQHHWRRNETFYYISLLKTKGKYKLMLRVGSQAMYADIVALMARVGYHKDAGQLREKLKELKAKYYDERTIKKEHRTFVFYDAMDELMSERQNRGAFEVGFDTPTEIDSQGNKIYFPDLSQLVENTPDCDDLNSANGSSLDEESDSSNPLSASQLRNCRKRKREESKCEEMLNELKKYAKKTRRKDRELMETFFVRQEEMMNNFLANMLSGINEIVRTKGNGAEWAYQYIY